jgi:hypothetical protein
MQYLYTIFPTVFLLSFLVLLLKKKYKILVISFASSVLLYYTMRFIINFIYEAGGGTYQDFGMGQGLTFLIFAPVSIFVVTLICTLIFIKHNRVKNFLKIYGMIVLFYIFFTIFLPKWDSVLIIMPKGIGCYISPNTNECYYNYAIKNNNINYCQKIDDIHFRLSDGMTGYKKNCYEKIAYNQNNVDSCLHSFEYEKCYDSVNNELAFRENILLFSDRIKSCQKIENIKIKESCLGRLANSNQSFLYDDNIIIENDLRLCELVSIDDSYNCYMHFARELNKKDLCEKIPESHKHGLKEKCLNYFN